MCENPEVSIIVPARNEEQNIEKCLRSLLAQTDIAFEIIVVDDQSDDDTRRIAESIGGVRVISAQPLRTGWTGKVNAIQSAIPFARGRWLLFTDADTTHLPDTLRKSVRE